MALMTVNNHDEQGKDYRSQPRWSAGKKTEVVLRLLRGESLEELSRELKVEAHRAGARAGEAAQIAMEPNLRVAVVCRVRGAPRSTIYARRRAGGQPGRPGPVPPIGDEELVPLIRWVLAESPFAGEGYRKVRARLRREHGVHVSGKRVLRLSPTPGLLAAQPPRGRRRPRPHDGT